MKSHATAPNDTMYTFSIVFNTIIYYNRASGVYGNVQLLRNPKKSDFGQPSYQLYLDVTGGHIPTLMLRKQISTNSVERRHSIFNPSHQSSKFYFIIVITVPDLYGMGDVRVKNLPIIRYRS